MSTEANKALVRRLYEEVFNNRNLALTDELIAPEAISHVAPPGTPPVSEGPTMPAGPESVRQVVGFLGRAFPDFHFSIEELIAEGDTVVMRAIFSGTHRGEFLGIPPTGRHVGQQHVHLLRVQNAKIVEHSALRDDLTLLQQLGVIQVPGQQER
jgi:ketosteroid isomerase-like protein